VWVSNILLSLPDTVNGERDVAGRARALLNVLTRATSNGMSVILVSNEVGLGVVPPTALGRRYRDMLGRANQLAAAAADEVLLLIAGIELPLKTPPPDSQI
jgi:adenosylcobinamide kinase/adenosylcobinamide-phosphate guanylyltransferase